MDLLIATKNRGKIAEFENMLKHYKNISVKSLYDTDIDDIEETGTTFKDNSLIKAKEGFEKTGFLTIADDSGLEVDYLNGEPGVYSARYAGEGKSDKDKIFYLLEKMKDAKKGERGAQFKTVITCYGGEDKVWYFEGVWRGVIDFELKGDNGFGYDPIFFDPELNLTAAELTPDQKGKRSHRGKAMVKFLDSFQNILNHLER